MISASKSDRLIAIAKKHISNCSYKYKLCAIIYDKNKIMAIGVNSVKSYPFLKRFFNHATIHAEIAAMIQIMHYDNLKNLSMFVMRENVIGEICSAKPCAMCVQALQQFGAVKNVAWTTGHNTIECAKVSDMYGDVMKLDKSLRIKYNGKLPKRNPNCE